MAERLPPAFVDKYKIGRQIGEGAGLTTAALSLLGTHLSLMAVVSHDATNASSTNTQATSRS